MKTKTYLIMSIALLMGVSAWAQAPAAVSVYDDCSKNGKTEDIRHSIGEENGHTWVDLGLTSGTKWASCNVGATTPEESGSHYAWGETAPKKKYWWNPYKYANSAADKLTKYCTNAHYGNGIEKDGVTYGFIDNKTTLDPWDDAAHVNWGGDWRMPTDAEWTELREQCTWTWTTQNGVKGCQVTSKTNSNSIFLPAAGERCDGMLRHASNDGEPGPYGFYWSSSLFEIRPDGAWNVCFTEDSVYRRSTSRFYGFSVRPVCQ